MRRSSVSGTMLPLLVAGALSASPLPAQHGSAALAMPEWPQALSDSGPAMDEPPSPDPITSGKVRLLRESGLIARQSAIAESILIMERQLRQAELISKLMETLGPGTPIEIMPGEFHDFSSTPAGRRIAAEIEAAELTARIRLLQLKAEETALTGTAPPPEPVIEAPAEPVIWPRLVELFGIGGNVSATFSVDGESVVVREGDRLPDGTVIDQISEQSVVIARGGMARELTLAR